MQSGPFHQPALVVVYNQLITSTCWRVTKASNMTQYLGAFPAPKPPQAESVTTAGLSRSCRPGPGILLARSWPWSCLAWGRELRTALCASLAGRLHPHKRKSTFGHCGYLIATQHNEVIPPPPQPPPPTTATATAAATPTPTPTPPPPPPPTALMPTS